MPAQRRWRVLCKTLLSFSNWTVYIMQTTRNKVFWLESALSPLLVGSKCYQTPTRSSQISLFSKGFKGGDFSALLKQAGWQVRASCASTSDINEHLNSEDPGCLHMFGSRITLVNCLKKALGIDTARWFLLMGPTSSAEIFLALHFLYFSPFSC